MSPATRPLKERFWEKVDILGNCWIWTGATLANGGYGQVRVPGGRAYVHRVTYEWFNGPIPAGMEVDHLCKVRTCVNPDHLQVLSPKDHRTKDLTKELCKHGHVLSEDTCYLERDGTRKCRACLDRRNRARTTEYRRLHG